MTDDEINKRVAEIEGWKETGDDDIWFSPDLSRFYQGVPEFTRLWEICGPLVEKHWVQSWPMPGEADTMDWGAQAATHAPQVIADTPQRAICLSVIAAHEPMAVATTGTVWQGLGDK